MSCCAVVAACEVNSTDLRARCDAGAFDYVIAVDGGLAHLQRVGVAPDYILGDFDSLGYVPEGENVEAYSTHKDKSDLELALDYVVLHGFESVVVYGALGGRLDHTMAALQTCARFAEEGLQTMLVGDDVAVRILVGPATLSIAEASRGTVSVFSATDESVGVTERGMEYPLDDARLTNRTSLGLSNELIGKPTSVSVQRGTLYVFCPLSVSS